MVSDDFPLLLQTSCALLLSLPPMVHATEGIWTFPLLFISSTHSIVKFLILQELGLHCLCLHLPTGSFIAQWWVLSHGWGEKGKGMHFSFHCQVLTMQYSCTVHLGTMPCVSSILLAEWFCKIDIGSSWWKFNQFLNASHKYLLRINLMLYIVLGTRDSTVNVQPFRKLYLSVCEGQGGDDGE
jgi:hypothetical protein